MRSQEAAAGARGAWMQREGCYQTRDSELDEAADPSYRGAVGPCQGGRSLCCTLVCLPHPERGSQSPCPSPNLAITRNLSTGQNTPQVPSFYPYFIWSLKEHMTHVGLCQDQQHQASFVYELTPSSRTDFHEWSPCRLHCKALKSGKERTTLGPRKSQASGSPIIFLLRGLSGRLSRRYFP